MTASLYQSGSRALPGLRMRTSGGTLPVTGSNGSELEQRLQQRVHVLLRSEPIARERRTPGADANRQQAISRRRSESILVGVVIAHVDRRIARKYAARLVERHTLVRARARQQVDRLGTAHHARILQMVNRGGDRLEHTPLVPDLAVVHRHRVLLLLDHETPPRRQPLTELVDPAAHVRHLVVKSSRVLESVIADQVPYRNPAQPSSQIVE